MRMIAPLVASLLLAGCASMSGLDASSSFGCKAPSGVSCQSISGVEANAAQGNLPFQREDPAKTFGNGDKRTSEQGKDDKGGPAVIHYGESNGVTEKVSPRDMVAAHTGMPVRQPPLVLRVWMAPYEDDDKDLHDQSYFYTVVHTGKWMIEANTTALANQYRPTYPLARQGKSEPEASVDKDKTPLGQKNDYSGILNKQDNQAE